MDGLTKEEKRAIADLKRLAESWPQSLWLCSASGSLYVAKKRNGQKVMNQQGEFSDEAFAAHIDIENDGCG